MIKSWYTLLTVSHKLFAKFARAWRRMSKHLIIFGTNVGKPEAESVNGCDNYSSNPLAITVKRPRPLINHWYRHHQERSSKKVAWRSVLRSTCNIYNLRLHPFDPLSPFHPSPLAIRNAKLNSLITLNIAHNLPQLYQCVLSKCS